jgi:hypothetical protein
MVKQRLGNYFINTDDSTSPGNFAAFDHTLLGYFGRPYEGYRVEHNFRVNFEVVPGGGTNIRVANLSMRRFKDDSIVGSEIQIFRGPADGSQQYDFVTYTADANDPFVDGGFYFLLRNDSTVDWEIFGKTGKYLEVLEYYYKTYTKFLLNFKLSVFT